MKKYILYLLVVSCIAVIGYGLINLVNQQKNTDSNTINISASYRMFDQELLVNESEIAVKGTIEKVLDQKWNTSNNKKPTDIKGDDMIYRDIILKVSEVFKGNIGVDEKIIMRTFGGTVDNFTVQFDPQINFLKGEEVIVFLSNDDTPYNKQKTKDHYKILGGLQGIYRISGDDVQNIHEKLNMEEFKDKTKKFLLNPIVKNKDIKSDE